MPTGTAAPSAFELAQRQGDEAIRTTLLDAASRLLATEGPRALALRRIAAEAGCSTTVLYRMFGGKAGLTEALYIEGFERFRRRLAAVPHDPDPRVHLRELGLAYRANALAERNYYGLMFGEPLPGFQASEKALGKALSAYKILEDAVTACAAAGLLIDAPPGTSPPRSGPPSTASSASNSTATCRTRTRSSTPSCAARRPASSSPPGSEVRPP